MARTKAALPAGSRITDYISLGVIAKFVPLAKVREILEQTSRTSIRERDLPAPVVVYYVIALALYMRSSYREVLRCLLEGVKWLIGPAADVKVTGDSGISQARTRLGAEPLKRLYQTIVAPIADKNTKGAWYRQWRLVSLDEESEEGVQFAAVNLEPPPHADPLLERATDDVLRSLDPEDRFVLASYFLDGRTLAEIARALKVHESTISRKVEKLTKSLRKQITKNLVAQGMSRRQAEEALDTDVRDLALDIRSSLTQDSAVATFSRKEAKAGERRT